MGLSMMFRYGKSSMPANRSQCPYFRSVRACSRPMANIAGQSAAIATPAGQESGKSLTLSSGVRQ
jgi:hypothetical protein